MSHQKGFGSTVHPKHTWTSNWILEVACYPPCRSALGVQRRYFMLAVKECQVAAICVSAKVDGSEHRHFHMICPLSHLPLLLSKFNHISVWFLSHPDLKCSHVSVTEMHSVATPLTSFAITVSGCHKLVLSHRTSLRWCSMLIKMLLSLSSIVCQIHFRSLFQSHSPSRNSLSFSLTKFSDARHHA